jgi:hypothetical protein
MWIEVCSLREKILVVIHIQVNRKYENWYISKLSTGDVSKIVNNYYKKSVEDQLKIFKNQTTDSKLNTFANCYNEFSLQSYLDLNLSKSIVKNLAKLRISAHTLLIEKGGYFRPKL